MRLHANDCIKKNITARVFVDGVELQECFFADEEEGTAQVYVKQDYVAGMHRMPIKTFTGVVEIKINGTRDNGD